MADTYEIYDWNLAAEVVRDPELAYWLSRAEATFRQNPTLSKDMLRATLAEIGALSRCRSTVARVGAQVLSFLVTTAGALCVAVVSGAAPLVMSDAVFTLPLRALLVVIANLLVFMIWCGFVSPSITVHFARRAVIARDRLNRWLHSTAGPMNTGPAHATYPEPHDGHSSQS
jgi:hypothetical protein